LSEKQGVDQMKKDETKLLTEDTIKITLDWLDLVHKIFPTLTTIDSPFGKVEKKDYQDFCLRHAIEDTTKLINLDPALIYHPAIQNIISLSLENRRFDLIKRYLFKRIKEPLNDRNRLFPFFPAFQIFKHFLRKKRVRENDRLHFKSDIGTQSQENAIKMTALLCGLSQETAKKLIYMPETILTDMIGRGPKRGHGQRYSVNCMCIQRSLDALKKRNPVKRFKFGKLCELIAEEFKHIPFYRQLKRNLSPITIRTHYRRVVRQEAIRRNLLR
jgi:hypothetical protein